jgi:sulfatase maturation enzyme AslB (radical SAM superfamily)
MYQHAEVVHWMQHKNTHAIIPAQVDIDLTNICNQDCFYCNSAVHRASRPVQKHYKEYISLLDRLASWRAYVPNSFGTLHTITYPGGGEPTLLPGYEKVLEHTVDLGFLASLTTNGTKLDRMIADMPVEKIKKLAWIGIDIDAATEEKYEQIRRSIATKSPFSQVIKNAAELIVMGATVDIKALINQYNCDLTSIEDLFRLTKQINARQLYLRPTILDGVAYRFDELVPDINSLSRKYNVTVKYNFTKSIERNYTRCHQMYQFPVFCADGEIYVCCDNKGNPKFSLGHWDQGDFRQLWLSNRHHAIYDSVNTKLCPHCRPNANNIQIQNIINDKQLLESLYT